MPSTVGRRSSASPSCERSALRFVPALSRSGRTDATLLIQQRLHQVHGLDELVIAAERSDAWPSTSGHLELGCEFCPGA